MIIQRVMKAFEDRIDCRISEHGLTKETDYFYYKNVADQYYDKQYDGDKSSYPGINYRCNKIILPDGLELWFRIEVEHRLFAGFCIFDSKVHNEKSDYDENIERMIRTQFPKMNIALQ